MPCSLMKSQRGEPREPVLVKTWITPADASVPYSVAAAAPFKTSMRSIASGLMSSRRDGLPPPRLSRSEEHTSELQSRFDLVCRLLLEKKKIIKVTEQRATELAVNNNIQQC